MDASSEGTVVVTETEVSAPVPVRVHPDWRARHPWLLQGVTTRGDAVEPFDLGLFTGAPGVDVLARWERLRSWGGMLAAVHARQVHRRTVRHHREMAPGFHLVVECDGHVTRAPGLLLAVAVADCVPVTLVAPRTRSVGVVHAGWRGVAAGVVEAGLDALAQRLDVAPAGVEAHLGPAICGACYEVGPEVHRALGLPDPGGAATVDLRAVVVRRLQRRGVPPERISTSTWCTRCGDSPFFSHRGGDPHRQVAFVGVAG